MAQMKETKMTKTIDFAALAAAVAETSADANVAVSGGGGDYIPPAEGVARLRFIGYVEAGNRIKKVRGNPDKVEPLVMLTFELHGKLYPPKVLEDGTVIPQRLTVKLNHSLNEKAAYFKLFKRMNYEGKAKGFPQLLGQGFLGNVNHFKFKDDKGVEVVTANFRGPDGLTIRPPRLDVINDEGEVESKTVPVPATISQMRLFVWDAAPEYIGPMWDSLFIPGDEGKENDKDHRTRNVIQADIKKALNFAGSPIAAYLEAGGESLVVGQKVVNETKAGAKPAADEDDPLNDI